MMLPGGFEALPNAVEIGMGSRDTLLRFLLNCVEDEDALFEGVEGPFATTPTRRGVYPTRSSQV
jgi:hypothetical protein